MNLSKIYSKLCAPAKFYVVMSLLALLGLVSVYLTQSNKRKDKVSFKTIIFKIIYMVIWTLILDKICVVGWTPVSWLLVLSPLLLFFLLLGLLLYVR